ncbi:MAG: response regulator [Candidatus Goldiibacteriota bacterium]
MDEKGIARVLLAEDNAAEARLFKEILGTIDTEIEISIAKDGEDALKMLLEDGGDYDMILLDINMPKKDGFEVLESVRGSKLPPVIILTTSDSEKDIQKAYDMNANCFITKPAGLDKMIETVAAIRKFWIENVRRAI